MKSLGNEPTFDTVAGEVKLTASAYVKFQLKELSGSPKYKLPRSFVATI
jgi:hypothetical protein